jgi:hypothetical protein
MPEISRFYGIIIYLYVGDHNPPHIHAMYNEFEILIDIQNKIILEGEFPKRAQRLVLQWVDIHELELLANWENAKNKKDIFKITPLK